MSDVLREYRKLCIAIKALYDYSGIEWKRIKRERPNKLAQTIEKYEIIEDRIPIDKKELKREANEHNPEPYIKIIKRPIILPPLEKYDTKFIPTLTCDCDFTTESPSVRYGLLLLEVQEDDNYRFVEFRYELGHQGSYHYYPHAQFSRMGVQHECIDWIPTRTPAFPLAANGAVSLLLCIIISLYSKKISGKIVNYLRIDDEYKIPLKRIIYLLSKQ